MPIQLNTNKDSFVMGGVPVDEKIEPKKNKPERFKEAAVKNVAVIQGTPEIQKTFSGSTLGGGKVGQYLERLRYIDPTGSAVTNALNQFNQIKGDEKEYKGLKEQEKKLLNQKKSAFFKSDYFKNVQNEAARKGFNIPSEGDTDIYEGYLSELMINNPTAFKKEYKGFTPYFLTRGIQNYEQQKLLSKNK
jgi:hypothetical protein